MQKEEHRRENPSTLLPSTALGTGTTGGSGKKTLNGETHFWVVPWKSTGPTALVYLALAALIVWKRNNIKAAFRGFRDAK